MTKQQYFFSCCFILSKKVEWPQSITRDHEYSKELSILYAVKLMQTTWNHPKSPSTNRNHPKPPRIHPKQLSPTEPPTTPPRNELPNLTLFFRCWLWTWFLNKHTSFNLWWKGNLLKPSKTLKIIWTLLSAKNPFTFYVFIYSFHC